MSTFNSLATQVESIKKDIVDCDARLSSILIGKDVEVLERDKLSNKIEKVNNIRSYDFVIGESHIVHEKPGSFPFIYTFNNFTINGSYRFILYIRATLYYDKCLGYVRWIRNGNVLKELKFDHYYLESGVTFRLDLEKVLRGDIIEINLTCNPAATVNAKIACNVILH